MKKTGKLLKIFAAALLIAILSASAAFAKENNSGSFCFTASTSQEVLVLPCRISYEGDETVIEALTAAGIDLNYDGNFLQIVEGMVGNYTILYDGGGYDLNERASQITALCISENTNVSDSTLDLLKYIIEVDERQDHSKNSESVAAAYRNACDALTYAAGETVLRYKAELVQALADYDAIFNGEKYTVTAAATQNSTTLENPHIKLTDIYGNVTEGTDSINVVAGEYSYSISDGGWNRTDGTVSVSEDTVIETALPCGKWYGDIKLLDQKERKVYGYSQDAEKNRGTYLIPDFAGLNDVIINAHMGTDVPDRDSTELWAVYTSFNGDKKRDIKRSWESTASSLTGAVKKGVYGNEILLEARYEIAEGITQIQTYTINIDRIPTLSMLSVSAEGTVLKMDFEPGIYTYDINTVSKDLCVAAVPLDESYEVIGAGNVNVDEAGSFSVTVNGGGYTGKYDVNVSLKDFCIVNVSVPGGVEAAVYNEAKSRIMPVSGNTYHLIPGEVYTLTGTTGRFHTETGFTASAGTATVTVPSPVSEEALNGFVLYDGSNKSSRKAYETDVPFRQDASGYSVNVSDAASVLYLQADTVNGYALKVLYEQQAANSNQGMEKEVTGIKPVSETGSVSILPNAVAKSGYSNCITLRAEKTAGTVKYYQDYTVLICKQLHLNKMELIKDERPVTLYDKAGNAVSFNRDATEYEVSLENTASELILNAGFMNESDSSACCGGYTAQIGNQIYEVLSDIRLSLSPEELTETFEIGVLHADENAVTTNYVIHVSKKDPVKVTFELSPSDALCFIKNNITGERVLPDEDGAFSLLPGVSYTYTATHSGYIGIRNEEYIAPDAGAAVDITLTEAPESGVLPEYEAQWPSFRADDHNNGVVNVPVGDSKDNVVLNWATKLGDGYSSDACGCPIIVNGYLYTYARNRIFKIDTISGEVIAEGVMDHSSSFAINNPTYAEGMIFVGLADGTVQAFNAETLESLWIYHDELKGQPNCPIVYKDGYIYTGFWLGETTKANFAAISVTDEDPEDSMEEKLPAWTYTSTGGFYWAGAYAGEEYLVVGTDDGKSGYVTGHASILSLNRKDGSVIDSILLSQVGDIRSAVTFVPDEDSSKCGNCYFTTKGGYFYRVHIAGDGHFDSELKALKLDNYANDANNPAMSTCTPVIYNGRAYVGVSGTSQFGAYSGHNITVIDLDNFRIAYKVRTMGYPQTSGLLTTYYEETTGKVNVYFFDNFTPGKLRMLTDAPGQTEPDVTEVESYNMSGTVTGFDTAYVLFTPYAEQAQYAICSPIADEYGTIYFKNDSAYLMSLSSKAESLEITKQPDVTTYAAGDTFDGKGMEVTLHYANGMTRNVTNYVKWSEKPLTEEDTEFQIFFPYTMYNDGENGPGTQVNLPFAVVSLKVGKGLVLGDVTGDGNVYADDAAQVYAYSNGNIEFNSSQMAAGDVNGDGNIYADDAAIIYGYANGNSDVFPIESKKELSTGEKE